MRHIPLRPTLVWHSYLLFFIFGTLCSVWPIPAILCACLLLCLDSRLWHITRLIICLLAFVCPFIYACHNLQTLLDAPVPAWANYSPHKKASRICGKITQTQGMPDNRLRIYLENVHPETDSKAILPGICRWTLAEPPPLFNPLPGQTVCLTQKVKEIAGFANSPINTYAAGLYAKGARWSLFTKGNNGQPQLTGTASVSSNIRHKLLRKFLHALAPDEKEILALPQAKAILLALLFGDRQYIEQTTINNFALATFAHTLALSGQHLCIAGLIAMVMVYAWARFNPSIYLKSPAIILISILSWLLALLYLWIGNAPPSLLRAVCMLSIFAFLLLRHSVFTGLDLLYAAMLAILIYNPLAIFDLGLQLSAMCIAVIGLLAPVLKRIFPIRGFGRHKKIRSIFRYAAQIFLVSMAIQICLLPITLTTFSIAGFWFPLNILWLPVLGFIVLPLAVLGLLAAIVPLEICTTASSWILDLAALPCEWLLKFLAWLRDSGLLSEPVFLRPHWSAIIAFGLITIALAWFFSTQQTVKIVKYTLIPLFCALLFLAIGPIFRFYNNFNQPPAIEALDIGHGQAIILNISGNRILLDGGGSAYSNYDPGKRIIAPYLIDNAPPQLNAVFNSHPDVDHLGGLLYILNNFAVTSIFHNGNDAKEQLAATWRELLDKLPNNVLYAGDIINLGHDGLRFEVLHPPRGISFGPGSWQDNNASLILRLRDNNGGLVLFAGDVDKEILQYLLKNKVDISAKVVIAPQHGSDRAFLAQFYKASCPQLVIACCGYQNRWQYPQKKLRTFLAKNHVPLLDTGQHGKIRVSFEKNNLVIETIKGKSRYK